ncbi:hypothetical protein BDM02DRAFT_3123985 [Thelephora ganbajun]|uniref:Uncharacterized protein n=1 Tax=Thelephora ganbajun TaxID=370292 RepID=A0ACB6Z081_THEGA|nr:hypothetical protein BDM02DRAFT_3123985 [Thelephora ganbajun]
MDPPNRMDKDWLPRSVLASPSQIATPPANTNSDEDEEPVPISNNGSATSLRSRLHSP